MKNNGKGIVRKAGSVTGNTIVMSAGVLVMAAGAYVDDPGCWEHRQYVQEEQVT